MFSNTASLRAFAPAVLGLALAAGLPAASAAAGCVQFEGLSHCPASGKELIKVKRTPVELIVEMFDPTGADGVAIQLDDVRSWSSIAQFEGDHGGDARLLSTALADGVAVSTASLSRDGKTVDIAATFTGAASAPTYSVMIYDDGVLQAASGGHPSASPAVSVLFSPCLFLGGIEGQICDLVWEFHNTSSQSECMWRLAADTSEDFVFSLDGREVRGDEVRLVEELDASGGYPYLAFDEIVLQGTGDAIHLLSESTGR